MAGQSVFLSDADYDLEAELNASSRWPAQVLYKERLDPNFNMLKRPLGTARPHRDSHLMAGAESRNSAGEVQCCEEGRWPWAEVLHAAWSRLHF
jgi:hypothetical protein